MRLVYKDWFSGTPTYINTYIIIIKKSFVEKGKSRRVTLYNITCPWVRWWWWFSFPSPSFLYPPFWADQFYLLLLFVCVCVCEERGKKWGFKLVPVDLPCLKSLQQLGLRLVLLFGLWRSPPFFSRVCAHNQPTTLFYVYMFRSCAPQLGKGSEGWFPGKDRSGIFFFSPFPSPTFFPLIFLFLISFC